MNVVRPSVRLSRSGTVSKRLNRSSYLLQYMVAESYHSIVNCKYLQNSDRGTAYGGADYSLAI